MQKIDVIKKVEVYLVTEPVKGNLADATRNVSSIGFTIVKLTTEQGREGIGVTYNEVGGDAVKCLIENSIAPEIIGRTPFETEKIWYEMFGYLRGVGRKGVTFCALSAVDIAMWDLKGKILGMPLYRVFGGTSNRVKVYGSGGWTSYDDDELVEDMKMMVGRGFDAIKFKVGVEGGTNYKRDVIRVGKVREAVGPDICIMLDANNCWDASTGARFANEVKQYDVAYLEEPVFADDIPGLIKYKRSTDLPLASGEHEYTKYGARDLVLSGAVDIVQIDGTRAGGFTEMLKIAGITQAWNLKFAPHAMEMIHMHLIAAYNNAPYAENLLLFDDITDKTFKNRPKPVNGYLEIPEKPGLGLELDMDFVRKGN